LICHLKLLMRNTFSESIESKKALILRQEKEPSLRLSRALIKNLMKRNYIDLLS